VRMTDITPDLIKKLITDPSGKLFVPETITDAIGSCVFSDADIVEQKGDWLKTLYDGYQKKMEPMSIDYSEDATIDAYSVYYLPRNTLVPKIAILCCAYHPALQRLPDILRVLDLGSGTGGVILGLLDLFQDKALSGTRLHVIAADSSPQALTRQRLLIEKVGLGGSSLKQHQVDLSDSKSYESKLSVGAPYDMIFAANIMTELEPDKGDALFKHVASLLSDNGVMISVEAQRDYIMQQRVRMARRTQLGNLHVYYPCPPNAVCSQTRCWMWRKDEFECPSITVKGNPVESTNIQIAHWMILCTGAFSIYDVLRNHNPKLMWAVAAPYKPKFEGDLVKHPYEFCTEQGRYTGTITQDQKKWIWLMRDELFDRGSLIGVTPDLKDIQEGWDIVSGFVSY
jgi:SAM-dependent methyltransferase